MDLQSKVTPIIFHATLLLDLSYLSGLKIGFKSEKAETGRWDLAAKASLAADSSHLPGRVAAAPAQPIGS